MVCSILETLICIRCLATAPEIWHSAKRLEPSPRFASQRNAHACREHCIKIYTGVAKCFDANRKPLHAVCRLRHAQAGTYVAILRFVMRLCEAITIYLAAGAPFGVNRFLHQSSYQNRARVLLRAAGVILLWPFAAITLFVRMRHARQQALFGESGNLLDTHTEVRIAQAQRHMLASLRMVQELSRELFIKSEEMERAACVARQNIEKYIGLMVAASEVVPDGPPVAHELELCRIAGRTGDDLLLAGRCIHRRNVARLMEHKSRARAELLRALSEMRELLDETGNASLQNVVTTRYVCVALLKFYGHAINLLSLLEDESAATSVARLLDAECRRLRRLESFGLEHASERTAGEEKCTTHRLQQPLTQLPMTTTTQS